MSNRPGRDYEKDWEDFWKEIVCNPDGTINMDQLKRELSDHLMLQDHLGKIMCHVTGDRVSKLTTLPEVVCQVADDYLNEQIEEHLEELAEELGFRKDPESGEYVEIVHEPVLVPGESSLG